MLLLFVKKNETWFCPQSVHRLVLFAAPVIVCIECYNEGMKTGEDELGGTEEEVAFQQGLAHGWGLNRG